MGYLISVIGNSGVGKTTLARILARRLDLSSGLEQHSERPFQALCMADPPRYALANQIDYLLLRAEQELAMRNSVQPGILDGGLDLDFQLFNRRFFELGYMTPAEFALCERFYRHLRRVQPGPDVFILLHAPLEVIQARFLGRRRSVQIASPDDLAAMQLLLDEWAASLPPERRIDLDASSDDPDFTTGLPALLTELASRLTNPAKNRI